MLCSSSFLSNDNKTKNGQNKKKKAVQLQKKQKNPHLFHLSKNLRKSMKNKCAI